jgi:GNAT superfamily N-acetyltransferase
VNEPAFLTRALAAEHDRSTFTCGVEPLDRYFRQQVTQDVRRRIAYCFVMVETGTATIAGYYTLSATSIYLTDLPAAQVKRLPRYPLGPAVLLGRLAVAAPYQGRHLGAALLADAVERAARADIAAFAIVTDPKDERAHRFYARYGFADLPGTQRRLCVSMDSILNFLRQERTVR